MEKLLVVAKTNECGRLCGGLSHIVNFKPFALVGGGLNPARSHRPKGR